MRSWVGANSGMLTQKEIKFYEQKEDQTTVFRVHSIPGGMLYTNFDVSSAYCFPNNQCLLHGDVVKLRLRSNTEPTLFYVLWPLLAFFRVIHGVSILKTG